MTIVEFVDKSNIDNISSALIRTPERVIFVSSVKRGISKSQLERYRAFFERRGVSIEFTGLSLAPFKVDSIIDAFDKITKKYENCVFDLTGGNESYIVAAATVAERFPERKIQLHRYNIESGRIVDLDRDGKTILDGAQLPVISVAENIAINGGRVIFESEKTSGTHVWDDSVLYDEDVDNMWTICKESPNPWNFAVGVLERFVKLENGSARSLKDDRDPKLPASIENCPPAAKAIFTKLEHAGLITVSISDGRETVSFKSETVRHCLAKSGNLLELQVYRLAKKAQNGGEKVFTDALTGVLIDIDGDDANRLELTNEIDVILQRDLKPVFISCKNGDVSNDELYKLKAVTARFGGKYAKAVLVLGAPKGEVSSANFKERAKEYRISVIEIYNMTDSKFQKRIANLAH